ncbi:thioredoxin reductase-like selenoprotein t [Anaeramoeba flamelloides]|uniref:Thioredoxin reductase-like selenoprotein t n=1 Tax=Anaeramoeba flamelloides TaxID=1746091 RepID=A0ABQ8YGL9_9EUKA|nr:thioredoxin reductase-like selenoprotein t [Anaeramoeba flamelloides]
MRLVFTITNYYFEHFTEISATVDKTIDNITWIGNQKEPRVGAFEVVLENGKQIWSKLDCSRFPKPSELITLIQENMN